MRSKEQAHDYRYFPEPDLPPLILTPEFLAQRSEEVPEPPEARRARYLNELGLTVGQAKDLTAGRDISDEFDKRISEFRRLEGGSLDITAFAKKCADILVNEELSRLKAKGLTIHESPFSTSGNVAATIHSINGVISSKQLKLMYDMGFAEDRDYQFLYKREKPEQLTDASAIEKLIDEVIAANPKQVEQYRSGKKTVAGFFVGQVMRASKGQANPALLNELVARKLDS
jgi:aspartyl-tRNA(Asn)/glutamyl-tRNA(Gln) amidotransferase subunit B